MFQGKLGQLHIFKIEKDKGKPSCFFWVGGVVFFHYKSRIITKKHKKSP